MAEAVKKPIAAGASGSEYLERIRAWRETRAKLMRVIEEMIAEAHGRKQRGLTDDITEIGAHPQYSLRDKLQELSELSLHEPLPTAEDMRS
jgi:hypothetical protein